MKESGLRNAACGADTFGLKDLAAVHWNLTEAPLYGHAIRNGEATIVAGGALCAETGHHTGRSPKDKHTVVDALTENTVWWDGNRKQSKEQFETLYQDFLAHAKGKTLFAQDLYGGADPKYRIKARVYTELAWHSLFIRQLLIRPDRSELTSYVPDMTIIDMPTFKPDAKRHGGREGSDTMVAIDFTRKIVLICGSSYAGEMKKSVFTTLNFYLPAQGVMPMHCSANVGEDGDSALFFGLSGTGKTTLSADPNRTLIGDDENGWSPQGIFNFEGGCYAKTIKLSAEAEPEIWDATKRFGAVLENVVFDPETRIPDYDSDKKTENTRSAYPLDFIPNASRTGIAGHPKNIIFLTADAYRRDAADRQADARPRRCITSSPATPRRSPAPRRAWSASSRNSRPASARRSCRARRRNTAGSCAIHRQAQGRLLAGELRLDRRHLWRRPPHADQGDARAGHRRARRLAEERRASAPIRISASRCRARCRASSRICSIR